MLSRLIGFALPAIVAVALAAWRSTLSAPQKLLYDRLGGRSAITAVVGDFVGNVAADSRVNGGTSRRPTFPA